MFSIFRHLYRRTIIIILVIFYSFVRRIRAYYDHFSNECKPIRTNRELWDFIDAPINWETVAEPLTPRSRYQRLNDGFLNIRPEYPNVIEDDDTRPKVFVCHDMANNYLDDRFINGSSKWDFYRFKFWSGIDYFCYFSHNFVTIPPLPWINAAHKHGVHVLGTFIVENNDGRQRIHEILESEERVDQTVRALVSITRNCCFDGWLINIECAIGDVPLLTRFAEKLTEQLHDSIPHGKVFWYDSVVNTGQLSWQNELNDKNIGFYNVCDGILLNYGWKSDHLKRTTEYLKSNAKDMAKVFVGIDVFGRGQVAKFHTNSTLEQIRAHNFSVGIFAPGWTFERLQDIGIDPFQPQGNTLCNDHFLLRENLFWTLMWHNFYSCGPVTLPFYTSFCPGSGIKKYRDGLQTLNESWFNLMEQEYQPSVPSIFEYNYDEAYHGGSCIKLSGDVRKLRLLCCDFNCENQIVPSYVIKRTSPQIHVQLVFNIIDDHRRQRMFVLCDNDAMKTTNSDSIKRMAPLKGVALQRVVIALSRRQERLFSSRQPVNNWEAQYFYLKFSDELKHCRIVDVGLSITREGGWHPRDYVLLGAIHIHQGIANDERVIIDDEMVIQRNNFNE